ncbi:MAG: M14 family zinc carboxypeptidase [Phycisphaerae bacterium]
MVRKHGFVLALILTGSFLGSGPQTSAAPLLVELALPGADGAQPLSDAARRTWLNWLGERGFGVDRCGLDPVAGTVSLDLSDERLLAPLVAAGFTIVRQETVSPLGDARTQSQYFDPTEIQTMLLQAAADHPAIAQAFVVGTTFEGRDVYAIEISNNPGVAEDEPAIQFNGQHHAREVATSHVVMDVVETLINGYGIDPSVTQWVDNYKTVCVPMVNPDGVQYVFDVNSFWRKNRQFYPPSCTGVDLNRNYPYRWGPDRCGFASDCFGDTYQGPSVASEQETQFMVQLARNYHFVMATSYHAYGRFIDYPYACSNGSSSGIMPEHGVIDEMMNGVADAIDAVDGVPRYTVFSPASAGALSGDDTSWYYADQGTYPFIIEVGTSFEPAFSSVSGIVARNQGGWRYMYERLGQARIDVHVADACTSEPLEAEVTLTDFVFDTGESPRITFAPFGRWTFMVQPNATYTVRITKTGYASQEIPVAVGTTPTGVDVVLEPTSPCAVEPIPAVSDWGMAVLLLLTISVASMAFLKTRVARQQ